MMARGILLAGALLTALAAVPASAQVDLVWSHADSTVVPGTATRLSIVLEDTLDLRTVEFVATFDTSLVSSLSGSPGDLFLTGGFDLFAGFREEEPGLVRGYAVIMGHDDLITGPGELFAWDLTGKAVGDALIEVLDVKLYTPAALPVPDVTLTGTTVLFRAPTGVRDGPPAAAARLDLFPNPFNPRTRVSFGVAVPGPVRLTVHDARGRLVSVLYDGPAAAGGLDRIWDGRDRQGRILPGGTYLFRLETVSGVARTKGLLLK